MVKRHYISDEEVIEIEKKRKNNKDKMVDKWLEVLLLHAAGKSRAEIASKTDFSKQYITDLVGEYRRVGLETYAKKQYKGNHRNMSFAEEEAGFGRINKPKYCWCFSGLRPVVPCHHIREYRYAYGAVEPLTGEFCSLVLPYSNTICMNTFLEYLSNSYPNDLILLAVDRAAWHTAKTLVIPHNIRLFFLPPATPEMNPIEQVWKEIRKRGFKNEIFQTLEKVIDRLCDTICSLSNETVKSITGRDWIVQFF
jgi:putative transposase